MKNAYNFCLEPQDGFSIKTTPLPDKICKDKFRKKSCKKLKKKRKCNKKKYLANCSKTCKMCA